MWAGRSGHPPFRLHVCKISQAPAVETPRGEQWLGSLLRELELGHPRTSETLHTGGIRPRSWYQQRDSALARWLAHMPAPNAPYGLVASIANRRIVMTAFRRTDLQLPGPLPLHCQNWLPSLSVRHLIASCLNNCIAVWVCAFRPLGELNRNGLSAWAAEAFRFPQTTTEPCECSTSMKLIPS